MRSVFVDLADPPQFDADRAALSSAAASFSRLPFP
jgi:hypothetical protein